MSIKFEYQPKGVCSRLMKFECEDNRIVDVNIEGGCNGNLKGISSLLRGRTIQEAVDSLEGICCGVRDTSCPDQIAQALKEKFQK